MKTRAHRVLVLASRYIVSLAAVVFFFFPIFWIIMTAFKGGGELYRNPPVWVPSEFTLRQFGRVVEQNVIKSLSDSLLIAGSSTLLALLLGSLAAYGLARYRVGGDNLPFFILSQRFLPPVALIFPFLLFFKMLKWMDSHQAVIIMHLTFNLPYAVWMMRGFFQEIPREIEESALVDGCSPMGAFWRIALPLVQPGLVATGVFCLLFSWTEFFLSLTLTKTAVVPMSVYIARFFGATVTSVGAIGAASVLSTLPLFILGFVVQRYLVRGLTLGAVK